MGSKSLPTLRRHLILRGLVSRSKKGTGIRRQNGPSIPTYRRESVFAVASRSPLVISSQRHQITVGRYAEGTPLPDGGPRGKFSGAKQGPESLERVELERVRSKKSVPALSSRRARRDVALPTLIRENIFPSRREGGTIVALTMGTELADLVGHKSKPGRADRAVRKLHLDSSAPYPAEW